MKHFLYLFVFILIPYLSNGQGQFDARALFGINAAQIQGDNLAGYDKLGLTGGARLAYEVKPGMDAVLELLYSQRGSQNTLTPSTVDKVGIDLRYIEIPLIFSLKDWMIEDENYYKVRLDAGLSYGNLFSSSSTENALPIGPESYTQHDISYILGANYMFNARWGFTFRYTRSLNRLYKDPNSENQRLEGYFLTLRAEYRL